MQLKQHTLFVVFNGKNSPAPAFGETAKQSPAGKAGLKLNAGFVYWAFMSNFHSLEKAACAFCTFCKILV